MDILDMLLKNSVIRKLGAKRGYGQDVIEVLQAVTRVGQPADPAFPSDMLPIGARLYGRGLLTLLAVQPNQDWVWPFFIERQFNPNHPDFVGRGHSIMVLNTTHRNWTAVGCIGSEHEAVVDTRGLVTPCYNGWSADVWLREGGRLYAPSQLDSVRQYNVSRLPVIRTVFQAGSHEVQSEVFAARVAEQDSVMQKVTVRNTGSSSKKSSLIFSVRPYNPEGLTVIKEIKATEQSIIVDRKPGVLMLRKPSSVICSNEKEGDVSLLLDQPEKSGSARCRIGLCTAAAEYELELEPGKERVLWFIMPIQAPRNARGWEDGASTIDPEAVLEQTVRKWQERLSGTIQIDIPDDRLQRAFDINKSYLLLLWDGDAITPGPFTYHHFWFRDAAYQVSALDKMGFSHEARHVLDTYPGRQRKDGFYVSQDGEWDANGQAMWALYEHYLYTRDRKFLERVYPSMVKGVDWIIKKRMATTSNRNSEVYGLMPAGLSAEHFGPNDYYYWDDLWCMAGLRCAAAAAAELGKPDDQKSFHQEADRYMGHIEASLAWVDKRLGKKLLPASPYRRINSGAIGALCTLYPLNIYSPSDERIVNTMDEIREKSFFENGFFQNIYHSGVNAYLTMQFAQGLLQRRDPGAWTLLRYILDLATTTFTWPEAVHPRTLGGVMGDGHHGWAVADYLHLVRNLLLCEEGDDLVVFPLLPGEWVQDGKTISVREAPSHFGIVNVSMKVADGRAVIEFDNRYNYTPERLVVCFPRKVSTISIDGTEEVLEFTDRVELNPEVKQLSVTFA